MSKKLNLRERDGELDLSMSNLQEVPVRDIAAVKKATSLDLSNNRITSLGKNFAQLTHLVKLDLSKNQLKSLPDNFGDLVLLKHLDLYSNQLNHLPLSFGQLKNLKWLDLKNNPLVPALSEVAGPCQDSQQCQACARKIVVVIRQAKAKLEEEQKKLHQLQKEKEMAEKAVAKKEQQNNKKGNKVQEKKKNQEKGAKNANEQPVAQKNSNKNNEKKNKEKVTKGNNKHIKKNVNKPTGQFFKKVIEFTFITAVILTTILGFLYIVDIEKYRLVRDRWTTALNSTVNLLPVEVVTKGRQMVDFVRPTVDVAVGKFRVLLDQTSTMLNTNPVLKDHWSNINEISSVIGARLAEYMRTIYRQIPIYYDNAKNKLF